MVDLFKKKTASAKEPPKPPEEKKKPKFSLFRRKPKKKPVPAPPQSTPPKKKKRSRFSFFRRKPKQQEPVQEEEEPVQDREKLKSEIAELEARVNFLAEINRAIHMKENRVDVISQKKSKTGWKIRADINLDPFLFDTDSDGHILKFQEVVPEKKKRGGMFRR